VIVNPAAGRGRTRKLLPQLEQAARAAIAAQQELDVAHGDQPGLS